MNKAKWIVIAVLFSFLVGAFLFITRPWLEPLHPPPSEAQEYKKVTAPLYLYSEEDAIFIPYGSVIRHWTNGITEVYGPDNELTFIAKDSEAEKMVTPGSPPGGELKPATYIYHVPDGARISEDSKITKVYLGERLILTVINKSEDFPSSLH